MEIVRQPQLFDYAALDTQTRAVVEQRTVEIKALMKRAAQDILDIGQKLIEVKAQLGHGRFGAWLTAEFDWSDQTAFNFMNVARRFSEIPNGLEFAPRALYLLAAPSTPEAARLEAIDRAEAGEAITYSTAREIVGEYSVPEPPPGIMRMCPYCSWTYRDNGEITSCPKCGKMHAYSGPREVETFRPYAPPMAETTDSFVSSAPRYNEELDKYENVEWCDICGQPISVEWDYIEAHTTDIEYEYFRENYIQSKDGYAIERPIHGFYQQLQEREGERKAILQDALIANHQLINAGDEPPANHLILNASASNEWYTPATFVDAVREVMGAIDLDPASNDIANQVVKAAKIFTIDDDGLSQEWYQRVFLNPPYGRLPDGTSSQAVWSKKLIDEYHAGRVTEAVLLVNSFTGNAWFGRLWNFPICFAGKRIEFYTPDGTGTQPTQSNAFVYLGGQTARFVDIFSRFGAVVIRVATEDGIVILAA